MSKDPNLKKTRKKTPKKRLNVISDDDEEEEEEEIEQNKITTTTTPKKNVEKELPKQNNEKGDNKNDLKKQKLLEEIGDEDDFLGIESDDSDDDDDDINKVDNDVIMKDTITKNSETKQSSEKNDLDFLEDDFDENEIEFEGEIESRQDENIQQENHENRLSNSLFTQQNEKNNSEPVIVQKPIIQAKIIKIVRTAGELWVEKYKPKTTNDLLGNYIQIETIKYWLQNWESNHLFKKPKGKGKKTRKENGFSGRSEFDRLRNDSIKKKSILLSGMPGIGKSSAAKLICEENNYKIIELNASDTRSKKILQKKIGHLIDNKTINQYFGTKTQREKDQKTCIVMDEVDGMSAGDKGGIRELIDLIKKTKCPIICICNDRNNLKIKSLLKVTVDLRFEPPKPFAVEKLIQKICEKEKFLIDRDTVMTVIHSLRGDVRSIINHVQFLNKIPDNQKEKFFERLRKRKENPFKDVSRQNPFEISKFLLENKMRINQSIDNYFMDTNLIPLFMQQNYLNVIPNEAMFYRGNQHDRKRLEMISLTADDISKSDLIDKVSRQEGNFKLMPDRGIYSTSCVNYHMKGKFKHLFGYDNRIQFPSILGNTSKTRKNISELKDIHRSSSIATTGNSLDVMDYYPLLSENTSSKIGKEGDKSFDKVVNFMTKYGIDRNDIEVIENNLEKFSKKNNWKTIPSKVKSSFTRHFKKKMEKITKVKGKKKLPRANDLFFGSESEVSEDEGSFLVNKSVKITGGKFTLKTKKKKRKRKGSAFSPKKKRKKR